MTPFKEDLLAVNEKKKHKRHVRVEQSTYVCFFCNTLDADGTFLYHNLNYVKLKGKIHLSSCVITDTNVFAISMVTFRACAPEAPL